MNRNIKKLEDSVQAKVKELSERSKEISDLNKKINELEKSIKSGKLLKEKEKEIASLKTDIVWLKELNDTFKSQKLMIHHKDINIPKEYDAICR